MKNAPPPVRFAAFGHALTKAREDSGILTQQDLADRLRVTQQTVSRWEAGTHRPRANQLPSIAAALHLNVGDLRRLVGDDDAATPGVVLPFPLDRLAPETFEQFMADLLQYLHPSATVRRAGTSGHTQHGIDISVSFSDGRALSVQCKREKRFGPSDFADTAHVAELVPGDKILALSRTASPQTAAAVQATPHWSIWDKDDISRLIRRQLSADDQTRLTDIYFPGQRLALLGRDEPGPWRNCEEFFRPFSITDAPLSHTWSLFGRTEELETLYKALRQPNSPLIFLSGPGGFGKSRLLKTLVTRISATEPVTKIRFLAANEVPSWRALEDLGPGPKILVIDDAHDREALGLLYEFSANPEHQTRLVVATRPYATERLRREAAAVNLGSPPVIPLRPLSKDDLTKLAAEILQNFEAPVEWAEHVVAASYGSPMIVAMGARIVAKEHVPLELAKSQSALRGFILQKFSKIIAGELGGRGEEELYRTVLELLALVQPFHPEDQQLIRFLTSAARIATDRAERILKRLIDGGVIYHRGSSWRLMPDVLGDYLIEESCLDAFGKLSNFAENIISAVPQSMLKQVMENLVRMDWRRNNGDTSDSILLSNVWHQLKTIDTDWDPRIEAIKAMALYQPKQALEFVSDQIRRGRRYAALSEILRNIAFTSEYFDEVLEMLWALGREDGRDTGPHPAHPIRTLVELGAYGERKPLEPSKKLLAFGMKIAAIDDSWESPHTPVDILKPLLATEGVTTESSNTKVLMTPFLVNYEVVLPLRDAVIEKSLELIRHSNPKIACLAVELLRQGLHSPLGYMGNRAPLELYQLYNEEFARTLGKIQEVIKQGLHPITTIIVARAVKWLAQHSIGECSKIARGILGLLPTDINFQVRRMLIDGHGETFLDSDDLHRDVEQRYARLTDLANAIRVQIPAPNERLAFIEFALADITACGDERNSEYGMLQALFHDESLALAAVRDAFDHQSSLIRPYAQIALNTVLRTDQQLGRDIAQKILRADDPTMIKAVAMAYAGLGESIGEVDQGVMRDILGHSELSIVGSGIRTVSTWGTARPSIVLDLLLSANIQGNSGLANEVGMALSGMNKQVLKNIVEDQTTKIFEQLLLIPRLDGYWIDELLAELSFQFPSATAQFLMKRVERASQEQSFAYSPINPSSRGHRHLRFLESNSAQEVITTTWAWLLDNRDRDHHFQYASQSLFEAMFLHDERGPVEFFNQRLVTATSCELVLIADMLRKAKHSFVFDQPEFVISFLGRCQTVDLTILERAIHSLCASATSGMRSGFPGKPMPRDLADQERATDMLNRLSRISPAYHLYELINSAAAENIKRTVRKYIDEETE